MRLRVEQRNTEILSEENQLKGDLVINQSNA